MPRHGGAKAGHASKSAPVSWTGRCRSRVYGPLSRCDQPSVARLARKLSNEIDPMDLANMRENGVPDAPIEARYLRKSFRGL
jgi:hypothetical protein